MAKKTVCAMCGKELGMMSNKMVLKDGVLCSQCARNLPPLPLGSTYTLDEARNILENKEKESNGSEYTGVIPRYVVLQVVLKEAHFGTGSGNLPELEFIINRQAAKGYRLHTMSTTSSGSKGVCGGDRIQATLVFEKLQ